MIGEVFITGFIRDKLKV